MAEQDKFEAFMKSVLQRDLPGNPMARIRILAKELAEGASGELWGISFHYNKIDRRNVGISLEHISVFKFENITHYLEKRWNREQPSWDLLVHNGYLGPITGGFIIEPKSFELVTEVEPANVFISYRRDQSSALALLILARLKAIGLNPRANA